MIRFTHKGDFEKTTAFFKRLPDVDFERLLKKYGEQGLVLLRQNTPVDTGESSESWAYQIKTQGKGKKTLVFTNSDVTPEGVPIVILLQYGHGTKGGAYVQGKDFINPVMVPLFEKLSEELWEEVRRL
jgi:hypothetical protein